MTENLHYRTAAQHALLVQMYIVGTIGQLVRLLCVQVYYMLPL